MSRRLGVVAGTIAVTALFASGAIAASSPAVTTGSHSKVKDTSAQLDGTINPNGSGTTYLFQWGLTNSYGVNSSTHSAGSRTSPVAVHVTAGGLIPGTSYHYRLVATNKFGTSAGVDRTFKTAGHPPPGVTTGPVSALGSNFATVTGVISPEGAKTTWAFQYGLTSSYTAQSGSGTLPASSPPVPVSQTLQGLTPGTIFHYRLAAIHGTTTGTDGADATFMTYPAHRPVPGEKAHTRPGHAAKKPFVFSTSGSVAPPSSIPGQFGCSSGFVGIRYLLGRRTVNFVLAPLAPNCTFSGQATFEKKPGRGPKNRLVKLHLVIHFRGNGYLAPTYAKAENVSLG